MGYIDIGFLVMGLLAFLGWIIFASIFDTRLSYIMTFVFGFTFFIHGIPFTVIKLVMYLSYVTNKNGNTTISELIFADNLA